MTTEQISPGLVIAGRYRVVQQLGEGGIGSVHLVQHVHTDERLALKVLHSTVLADPTAIERFRTEARVAARIESDHVVRVTDADVAPELSGAPFLVMEFLRGQDLSNEVYARGALHPKEVVVYLRQTARALDKAHAIGIIHRDLKPENIFLTVREDGTPHIKLLDFGIAKITGGAAAEIGNRSKTKTGTVFGTPLYMAPEQARGQAHLLGPTTDVWALGLIAVKLLLGIDYWTAETMPELVVQIVVDPIPAPSQRGSKFGPAFDAWFFRCCNRDPSQRFRSAGEAVSALAQALGIHEGPQLVLEAGEILRAAQQGGPVRTSQPTVAASPVFGAGTPPPAAAAPAGFNATPGQVQIQTGQGAAAATGMGATVLAASTDPRGNTASPATPARGGSKLPLVLGGLALVASVGAAAFLATRSSADSTKPQPAAQPSAPAPIPLPKVEPQGTVAAVVADPLPTVTASAAVAPVMPGPKPTVKTSTGTPTKSPGPRPPSDADLMSGRR
jgi:serine/threonine-protein kinase